MRLHDIGLPLWTVLALLFALTTGGPFPWFLFYFLAGALVLSGLWAWHAHRSLDCCAAVDRAAATAGDEVELRLELENQSLLPVPRVLVLNLPGQAVVSAEGAGPGAGGPVPGDRVKYLGLGPLATVIDRRRLRLDRRGRYRLGPIVVEAQDPLGIFRIRRVVHAEPELTVLPRPWPVHDLPIAPRQPFGRQPTRIRAWQDPSSLNEVRPFRPGDNPKHIHWKLSARFGELHVKEFDLRATTDCVVFIDLDHRVQAGQGAGSTVEAGISLAAGVAVYALQRDLPVGAVAHDDRLSWLPPGRGARHYKQFMRWLVELGDGGNVPVAELLATQQALLTPRSAVVVITPALPWRLATELVRLRRQGHSAVLFLLRRETFQRAAPHRPGDEPPATWTGSPGVQPHQRQLRALAGEGVPVFIVGPDGTPAPLAVAAVPPQRPAGHTMAARWQPS
ncbi:MAG TPA: DUF58 domain-containing protein [Thermaerobacter sp.]